MLDTSRAHIEAIRSNVSRLAAERDAVRSAYFDGPYVERRADAMIAGWAERARDAFEHLGSRGGGPASSEISSRLAAVELAAILQPEALKKAMIASARTGISDTVREQELKRLDTEIKAAEIAEELALREIDAVTGNHEKRRLDARIDIILAPSTELQVAAKPAKAGGLFRKAS